MTKDEIKKQMDKLERGRHGKALWLDANALQHLDDVTPSTACEKLKRTYGGSWYVVKEIVDDYPWKLALYMRAKNAGAIAGFGESGRMLDLKMDYTGKESG